MAKSKRTISRNAKTVVTVGDVYGEDVRIPDGYDFVGFRPLSFGDKYISIKSGEVCRCVNLQSVVRIVVEPRAGVLVGSGLY